MRLLGRSLVMVLLFLAGFAQSKIVEAQQASLKVLYVGESLKEQSSPPSYIATDDRDRFLELKKERPKAFRQFLGQHFETVKAIESSEYRVAMSGDYDVTIFDARPPVIDTVTQKGGWEKKIRLPDDFSYPALFVGEVGPMTIGRFGNDFLIDHL